MDQDIFFEKYLLSTYRFLNYRLRSEKEIRDNLEKKNASEEIIEKIIAKLRSQRLVNDETFARTWVESRSRSKPRSQYLLRYELQQKGISKEIIDQVIIDTPVVRSDLEMAEDLVERKVGQYNGMERHEIYNKLGGVLARKGFSWAVSKKAIDNVLAALNK